MLCRINWGQVGSTVRDKACVKEATPGGASLEETAVQQDHAHDHWLLCPQLGATRSNSTSPPSWGMPAELAAV